MSVLKELLMTIVFTDLKSLGKKKFWSYDEISKNMLALNIKLTCVVTITPEIVFSSQCHISYMIV